MYKVYYIVKVGKGFNKNLECEFEFLDVARAYALSIIESEPYILGVDIDVNDVGETTNVNETKILWTFDETAPKATKKPEIIFTKEESMLNN